MSEVTYSVVIPVKDEEENILPLIEEIEPVMESLKAPWELICVDDGSTDGSLQLLKNLNKPYLRLVVFTKNFGQTSAFDAGFKEAKGEYVITLDGDGQNDPNDIPRLAKLMDSCDLACGWRVNRRDSWTKKIISKCANLLRSRLCKDGIHDTGCSLKVYRRSCLQQIKLFHGMHRFLPALFAVEGFRVRELAVNHRERERGVSKYHIFNRSIAPIVDMFALIWMRRRCLRYSVEKEL